jgi:hypothetical protein
MLAAGNESEDDGEPDPDFFLHQRPPVQKAFLILGRSGTGKSVIAAHLAKMNKGKKTVVINDTTGSRTFPHVRWEDAEKLNNVQVIFEDLVALTRSQSKTVQTFLSWHIHHRRCNYIFLCAHSVFRNAIFHLLHQLTHVIFTCNETSLNSLMAVLASFKYEPSEKHDIKKMMQDASAEPYSYLCLDLQRRQAEIGKVPRTEPTEGDGGGSSLDAKTPAQITAAAAAKRFLSILNEPVLCLAIHDMVFPKIPAAVVDPNTLAVTLYRQDRSRGKTKHKKRLAPVRFSLVDYYHTLVQPDMSVSDDLAQFHSYILNLNVCLPHSFVKNKRFQLYNLYFISRNNLGPSGGARTINL